MKFNVRAWLLLMEAPAFQRFCARQSVGVVVAKGPHTFASAAVATADNCFSALPVACAYIALAIGVPPAPWELAAELVGGGSHGKIRRQLFLDAWQTHAFVLVVNLALARHPTIATFRFDSFPFMAFRCDHACTSSLPLATRPLLSHHPRMQRPVLLARLSLMLGTPD